MRRLAHKVIGAQHQRPEPVDLPYSAADMQSRRTCKKRLASPKKKNPPGLGAGKETLREE